MIKNCGYPDVSTIGTAEEATELLQKNSFDCIFLDWNLPKMSGLDFLKFLRDNPSTKKTTVVMVTTVQERTHILEALKIGVQGYLIKPITKEMIASKLKELEPSVQINTNSG
jgi:two-component system chemotaxis response regulator CheY